MKLIHKLSGITLALSIIALFGLVGTMELEPVPHCFRIAISEVGLCLASLFTFRRTEESR